jgi:hypothetical protein
MILENGKDPVSAKWNGTNWEIGERVKYRWLSSKNKPTSEWFSDINDALDWIIQHDTKTN